MRIFPTLARWHIWLGWLIAVPLLLWTASGLFMVSFPIEQVRGEHLRAAPLLLPESRPDGQPFSTPQIQGWWVTDYRLIQRIDRTLWVVERADGSVLTSDAMVGEPVEAVDAPLARRIANAALKAPATIASIRRFAADANPIDLRRDRPAWQVEYTDGVRVYVDADTGEVLAVRTRLWRAFDFMWGLHIMDLQSREDTHHPLLVGFAALAFLSVLVGTILLFRRRRSQPRRAPGEQG